MTKIEILNKITEEIIEAKKQLNYALTLRTELALQIEKDEIRAEAEAKRMRELVKEIKVYHENMV